MFITFYGINNIGKSTQAHRLVERLKREGYDAVYVKYPVYEVEPSGVYLNQVLRHGTAPDMSSEELQTWFTVNRFQVESTLKEWLSAGRVVVAEDYTGTGIAWGTVKGADTEWLESLNQHLIKEDLAILFDGERYLSAIEDGHIHESNDELMRRSRQVHLDLGQKYGWQLLAVEGSIEAMEEKVWNLVLPHLAPKK